MATGNDTSRARADASFRPKAERHEKGSAMDLIAAEAKATESKTARLRRLREERDIANPPPAEPVKPARRTTKKAVRG